MRRSRCTAAPPRRSTSPSSIRLQRLPARHSRLCAAPAAMAPCPLPVMTRRLNKLLNRLGLQVTKHEAPGRIPWVLKNLDTSPSAFRWTAPELIRRHDLQTFVQVGANDGQCGDPVEACIEAFNLSGVMVEPQPGPCALLRAKHAGHNRNVIDQVAV